ncbi:MAG: universal stress protein [Syntrophales bacterium]
MFQRILVVLENGKVCQEALDYARGLALRMSAEVTFLMLVEMSFLDRPYLGTKRNTISRLEDRMGKIMAGFSASFLQEGVAVGMALRLGDPAEELLKFLAGRSPFHAIIWGSGVDISETSHTRKGHWLSKVAGSLECPVFTVSAEAKGTSR